MGSSVFGNLCWTFIGFTASGKAQSFSRGTVGMATDTGACSWENKHEHLRGFLGGPPASEKYHHHLKRFQSRLRILSNKVEWGDKKPKQQETIFSTGVSQFSLYKMLWGGEPKVEFVLILW